MLDSSFVYQDFASRTPAERKQTALELENLELRQTNHFLNAQLAGAKRQIAALQEDVNKPRRFSTGDWCLVALLFAVLIRFGWQVLS